MTRDHLISKMLASDIIRLDSYLKNETPSMEIRERVLNDIRQFGTVYKLTNGDTIGFSNFNGRYYYAAVI